MNEKTKSIFNLLLVILFFILFSYLIQTNLEEVSYFMGDSPLGGALAYIIIITIAVVIAPVSAIPILPMVSNMYGWFTAGVLSIIGWTLGGCIAFIISRKYGTRLVKKLVSVEKINKLENRIPKKNIFWSIVFLRMSIPVDILSYALGLFSNIKFRTYFLATLIGVTPFAFVLAYVGTLSFYYQLTALTVAGIIIILGIKFRK